MGIAGVAGNDGVFEEVGVGLVDSLLLVLGATGKLSDSRFGLRGLYDNALECLIVGLGGGDIAKYALFGEVPVCGLGGAAGWPLSPVFRIDSAEARSTLDLRRW